MDSEVLKTFHLVQFDFNTRLSFTEVSFIEVNNLNLTAEMKFLSIQPQICRRTDKRLPYHGDTQWSLFLNFEFCGTLYGQFYVIDSIWIHHCYVPRADTLKAQRIFRCPFARNWLQIAKDQSC